MAKTYSKQRSKIIKSYKTNQDLDKTRDFIKKSNMVKFVKQGSIFFLTDATKPMSNYIVYDPYEVSDKIFIATMNDEVSIDDFEDGDYEV